MINCVLNHFVVSGIILFLMLRAVAVCVGVLSEVCASIQRQLLAALGVHFTIPHLQNGTISIIFQGYIIVMELGPCTAIVQ